MICHELTSVEARNCLCCESSRAVILLWLYSARCPAYSLGVLHASSAIDPHMSRIVMQGSSRELSYDDALFSHPRVVPFRLQHTSPESVHRGPSRFRPGETSGSRAYGY